MLSIRLSRTGKTHDPHYRIVVQERRSKLNGGTVDIIGHYHPAQKDKLTVINKEKAELWLSRGAQPSDTVTNLMVKQGILAKDKTVHHFFTPVKAAVEAAPVEEASASEEPVAEEVVAEPEMIPAAEEAAAEEPAA